jgi:transglutaminase-like putative cysteine protease
VKLTGNATSPATASLIAVPSGVEGVKRTLAIMVDLVKTYSTDLNVRTLAVQLIHACAAKDARCELQALQHFVRDQIRYTGDVRGTETVQTPVQTLKLESGDCDDKATVFNALAASVGFATRFCAIAVRGGDFSHVMAQARLGSGWVNAETIVPGAELGWFPPDATQCMLAHVN